jgi:hypothetical protein
MKILILLSFAIFCSVFGHWWIVAMYGIYCFFYYYDVIHDNLPWRNWHCVTLYEYSHLGTRKAIWQGKWKSYGEARSAGQAVLSMIEQQTKNCNYTYEVTEIYL